MISSYKHKAFPLLLLVFSAFSIFAEDNQPTFVGINALTDASSKSLALRVLGTAGDENTEGELKILVLTPKLSNINTSNKRDLIVNIQDALVENFNSYENVKAFYDDEKSDALYNFLQTIVISVSLYGTVPLSKTIGVNPDSFTLSLSLPETAPMSFSAGLCSSE